MNLTEKQRLARAWIKFMNRGKDKGYDSPEAYDLFSVFNQFDDLVVEEPQIAWEIILMILAMDQSSFIMEVLSAGPLEDLLAQHGESMIDTVEREAKANPSFANLLGGVWKNQMKDEVWERVQAVWDRRGWDGIPEEEK